MENDPLQKIRQLPDPLKTFFFGEDPRVLCEEACMLYGLSEDLVYAATFPLADIFIEPTSLAEYPIAIAREAGVDMPVAYGIAYEVNRRIFLRFPEYFTDAETLGRQWEAQKAAPSVSLEEAKRKVLELEPWLLERDEEDEDEGAGAETAVRLPLLRAVGEYPNIGNQQITRERIRLQGRQDTVRPSLANWVKSYRNELGVGYHEPVVRAKFLFDSENGKKLSSEERERLNMIIRSIEENEPLEIDTERGEIVFSELETPERAPKAEPKPKPEARRAAPAMGAAHIGQASPNMPPRPLVKPAPSFPDVPAHAGDTGSAPSLPASSQPSAHPDQAAFSASPADVAGSGFRCSVTTVSLMQCRLILFQAAVNSFRIAGMMVVIRGCAQYAKTSGEQPRHPITLYVSFGRSGFRTQDASTDADEAQEQMRSVRSVDSSLCGIVRREKIIRNRGRDRVSGSKRIAVVSIPIPMATANPERNKSSKFRCSVTTISLL